jgi:hypothetical protein
LTYNDRIRRIAPDGQVGTVAGDGRPGYLDGAALGAQFDTPCALVLDAAGQIYIADARNEAIRKLGADGQVGTVARAPEGRRDGMPRLPTGLPRSPRGRRGRGRVRRCRCRGRSSRRTGRTRWSA